MTPREKEFSRIEEAVQTVFDDDRMLFCILVGDDPKEARPIKYEKFENVDRKISTTHTEAAQALYKVAATEFSKFSSQRLCSAIEHFLATVMSAEELKSFKAQNPMKYPIRKFANILEEIEFDQRTAK